MFRFVFAGQKQDESLDLGPRLLRELGPVIEDELVEAVGPAQVTREGLGRGLAVRVQPRGRTTNSGDLVRDEIGEAILNNLMDFALENPSGPVISAGGQFVAGGRVDGRRHGL